MKAIEELLNHQYENRLYPFFWQKGQSDEVIREYIAKMAEQNIFNFCVESRPHPEFLEDGWWHTMDVILEEAKKHGMHIWILDDAKFPTGYANGKVPAELKKKYLYYHRYDLDVQEGTYCINVSVPGGIRTIFDPKHKGDNVIAAVLVSNDTGSMRRFDENSAGDVTDQMEKGLLKLDLKSGKYSVFALYETICGNEKATEDYLDPMNPSATKVLLDEIYEKHYMRYKEEFGKTITGFFSDEPRFGNTSSRNGIIGKTDMPLPWNHEVLKLFTERGNDVKDLIFLFQGEGTHAKKVRFDYMDIVSGLYSRHFSEVLGSWCREHDVMYVGHTIEDDNVHARLGQGCGHYFRALSGEDVAGIDVIGGQIVPGMDYPHDAFSSGGSDGEFYHYALTRMAASAAKHDPKKQGRVMCEAFGAYGWAEGLKMMKWITDHLISHGVNMIVPHAFDPSDFPDIDCPPHFYAHGNNPQYPYFGIWAEYADRLCHLFSNGVKAARIGVLYHAFAEWSGETMYFQKVCKVLQQVQIDTDIISEDELMKAEIKDGKYIINGCAYTALIIPGCTDLPKSMTEKLRELSETIRVVFAEKAPESCDFATVFQLTELPAAFTDLSSVSSSAILPHLNVYEYDHEDGKAYMFFNEDVVEDADTVITVDCDDELMVYDAMQNKTIALEQSQDENGRSFRIHLNPYESVVIVSGHADQKPLCAGRELSVLQGPSVSRKAYNAYEFSYCTEEDVRNDWSFSGTIRYEYTAEPGCTDVIMKIDGANEVVHVIVNGKDCGTRIAPPYIFDLSQAATIGINVIVIEVINTLVNNQRDLFSMYLPIEQNGIRKNPALYIKEE